DYILPVDFAPDSDIYTDAFSISNIRDQVQGKNTFQLWMVDAATSRVSTALRAVPEGLAAPKDLSSNVLVMLGAQADQAGPEPGNRKSGLLAEAFKAEASAQGVEISELFNGVRRRVSSDSRGAQLPLVINNINCSYWLREPPPPPDPTITL